MINTAKAYLGTEGKVEYRGCAISYYTYSMSDQPSRFKIVVNVELHYTQNDFVKTLNTDDTHDKEDAAINHGVEQAKRFIDHAYELGKVDIAPSTNSITARNAKEKEIKNNKDKVEKTKTDKKQK